MTIKEVQEAFEELRKDGQDDEDILAILYLMFQDDKIDINELSDLVQVLGYELTPEFLAMSPEDQKTKGYEEIANPDITEKEIEEAKEIPEDEEKEKGKDGDDEDEDEEVEKARAKKLFGM
ncbi:hypothetical protein [Mammaliicoccus vitulinus]|uniref:hypothetical protein n=1 Tax=Mammaliicoccus vitulinus TaxID=71237 RepID=UPI00248D2127|nr:hypothetical protein [Mammaliicoccus vitulinus]